LQGLSKSGSVIDAFPYRAAEENIVNLKVIYWFKEVQSSRLIAPILYAGPLLCAKNVKIQCSEIGGVCMRTYSGLLSLGSNMVDPCLRFEHGQERCKCVDLSTNGFKDDCQYLIAADHQPAEAGVIVLLQSQRWKVREMGSGLTCRKHPMAAGQ
jgi:hypothetical protein